MKKNILFILILISASIWGCEKAEISPESDDFIHVNVEGAQLPVLIREILPPTRSWYLSRVAPVEVR